MLILEFIILINLLFNKYNNINFIYVVLIQIWFIQ